MSTVLRYAILKKAERKFPLSQKKSGKDANNINHIKKNSNNNDKVVVK